MFNRAFSNDWRVTPQILCPLKIFEDFMSLEDLSLEDPALKPQRRFFAAGLVELLLPRQAHIRYTASPEPMADDRSGCMMNVKNELMSLVRAFDAAGLPYALCGGLAMAAHGWPRSTMDIDFMVEPVHVEKAKQIARDLGFSHEPGAMVLHEGAITLVRLVKFSEQDFLPLDLIVVGPGLEEAWASKEILATAEGTISVVSRQGLMAMKRLRGSGVDQDDIEKLGGADVNG
jgi:hypothetical protein